MIVIKENEIISESWYILLAAIKSKGVITITFYEQLNIFHNWVAPTSTTSHFLIIIHLQLKVFSS